MVEGTQVVIPASAMLAGMVKIAGQGLAWMFQAIFWAGILAHIVWWVGRLADRIWFFPERRICSVVHQRRSAWCATAKQLLSYWPQQATVLGFLCAPFWFCLIGLNIFLLAQVLELFFPGGSRIPFPWVGTYMAFPLIMGILWACTQTVLGLIFGHCASRVVKSLLLVILVFSIFAEGGLSAYRALLLASGEVMKAPTFWDEIILHYGPWLAALIGLVVPIAEVFAGYFGFAHCLEPMTKAVLSWTGGVAAALFSIAAWWVCGFHSFPPPLAAVVYSAVPPIVRTVRKRLAELEDRLQRLQGKITRLLSGLGEIPCPSEPVRPLLEAVRERTNMMKEEWKKRTDELRVRIATAGARQDLVEVRKGLLEHEVKVASNHNQLRSDIKVLLRRNHKLQKHSRQWTRFAERFTVSAKAVADMEKRLSEDRSLLTDTVQNLLQDQALAPSAWEVVSQEIMPRLPALKRGNEAAVQDLVAMEVRFTEKRPVGIVTSEDYERQKADIKALKSAIGAVVEGAVVDLDELARSYKEKRRKIERPPWWRRLLPPWTEGMGRRNQEIRLVPVQVGECRSVHPKMEVN